MKPKKDSVASFESHLQLVFLQKKKINNRYSLRAFARYLGTDVSQLSKVINGKRRASAELIKEFGLKMGLSDRSIRDFQKLEELRKRFPRRSVSELHYAPIQANPNVLGEYRHFLVYELLKIESFQSDFLWLSRVLQCPLQETEAIIERLVQGGLLKIASDGKWVHAGDWSISFRPDEKTTCRSRRKQQDQLLKLSAEALHNVSIEQRDHSSMMMATNLDKLGQAKTMITEFRRELCAFLEDTDKKNAVYALQFSLFPLADLGTG